MTLHATRAAALLSWVNGLHVAEPVEALLQLQDCSVFLKIIDSIHSTEEGQQILQKPVPERLDFVCSFLWKNRKHPSSPECLVSVQKVMEGSELELAKITMLLLYHSTVSSRSPRAWEQFEYKIQAELAVFLKFVLDHEDGLNLNEDLENFLQKAPVPSACSSTISEELSPPSHQTRREVRFLELQKVASSSGNNFLSGSPASPMGDILQTPQFQMRRLKKQLASLHLLLVRFLRLHSHLLRYYFVRLLRPFRTLTQDLFLLFSFGLFVHRILSLPTFQVVGLY